MRKSAFFYICENKDADQLRGNCEADQRLCFRYTDSTNPLFPKSEISDLLWLYSPVCVRPGQKFQRPFFFPQRGSYHLCSYMYDKSARLHREFHYRLLYYSVIRIESRHEKACHGRAGTSDDKRLGISKELYLLCSEDEGADQL